MLSTGYFFINHKSHKENSPLNLIPHHTQ